MTTSQKGAGPCALQRGSGDDGWDEARLIGQVSLPSDAHAKRGFRPHGLPVSTLPKRQALSSNVVLLDPVA